MSSSREEGDSWPRVKVKDEYYVLKESISDTSSSDSDDSSGSDSDSSASNSSSESSSSNNSNSGVNVATGQLITIKEEVIDTLVKAHVAKPSKKSLSPEYIPLRSKDSSSTTDTISGRKRSDSFAKETPERWRMRLWPSKAITSFCRIITRCKPPASTPGVRIGATGGNNFRNEKIELVAHWRKNELSRVPTVFNDPAEHSSVFFLLSVEECREAVTKSEDPDAFVFEAASRFSKAGQNDRHGRNGWLDGEITSIIAESPTGALPKACDPRLGSVWVVAAAITSSPNSGNSSNSAAGRHYQGAFSKHAGGKEGLDLSGGDLMVLHSPAWSHPLLGIIQPWDPDYDIKYGINFSINQSTYISTQTAPGREGASVQQRQVVNILVCVDQSDGLGQEDIGGWATQGSVRSGVHFSMAPIGNVMTYIRECQALMSLKLINRSLQNMVLSGAFAPGSMAVGTANTATTTTNTSAHASSSSASTSVVSSPHKGLSPRKVVLQQPLHCPENIPMPLWLALSRQYNDSQLRAICMVSRRYQEKQYLGGGGAGGGSSSSSSSRGGGSGVESSLSLLQGPPGTGKTRTILGIVSAFLAGALNLTAQGTTRIIAGASLYGETVGENATKWSDEKLTRPRGGSVSLSSSAVVDGSLAAGKRTRVLICAPSNTAVDEVVYRLITQGVLDSQGKRMSDLSVVRIGQPSRDEYQKQGIETFGKHNHGHGRGGAPGSDENMVRVVERATLDTLVEERRRALAASDSRSGGPTLKAADIRKQVLDQADVVCSTLSGAGSQPMLEVVLRMTGFKFDAIIIDEAAQAVEPSSLIPFKYNPQAVVLVGDPCQLPATVFSRTAKHANYHQSLFQRLQAAGYPVLMLETQYRMHPLIADYPSQRFYQGRLLTGSQLITSDTHSKPYHNDPSGRFRPFVFHNVSYSQEATEGTSICNREEALYVVALFEELVRKYPDHRGGIGIIAPYRAQRRLLNNLFRERFGNRKGCASSGSNSALPQIWDLDTEISTVDGFQGREKAIVIFSCVRAPTPRTAHLYKSSSSSSGGSSRPPLPPTPPPEEEEEEKEKRNGMAVPVLVQSRSMSELSSAGQSEGGSGSGSSEADLSYRSIGFLKEWQRLNVAITRSRYALWIVGHSDVLREDGEWRHLIEYSQNKGCFYTPPPPQHYQQGQQQRQNDFQQQQQQRQQQNQGGQSQQQGKKNKYNKWGNKNMNKNKQNHPEVGNPSAAGGTEQPSGKRAGDFQQQQQRERGPGSGGSDKKQKPSVPAAAAPVPVPVLAGGGAGGSAWSSSTADASPVSALAAAVANSTPPAPLSAPFSHINSSSRGSSSSNSATGPFSSSFVRTTAPAPVRIPVPAPGGAFSSAFSSASPFVAPRGPFSSAAPVVIKQEPQWTSGRPPLPPPQTRPST